MELMEMTLFFIISLSLILQAPCANSSLQIQQQSSHEKAIEVQLPDLPTLLRKLRITAEVSVKQHEGAHTMSRNKQELEPVQAGKKTHNEEKEEMHGSRGTWQELVERTDTSEYFTMDYSNVKRAPPIHNKALPVSP